MKDLVSGVKFPLVVTYRLVSRFYSFRKLIVDYLLPGLDPWESHSAQRWTKTRSSPHRWEYELFLRWPDGLHEKLLRLARRASKREDLTFIALHRGSRIRNGITYLISGDPECWATDPLPRAVLQLLDQFATPFLTRTPVLFNLHLTEEQRSFRMWRFGQWWQAIHRTFICGEPVDDSSGITWLSHPNSGEKKEMLVVRFINQLIALANMDVEPYRCHSLFQGWPSIAGVATGENWHELVSSLSSKLMPLPVTRLREMVRLADHACPNEDL